MELSVFADPAFSAPSLTASINVAPPKNTFIDSLGLFKKGPTLYSDTVMIEHRSGVLRLIPSNAPGSSHLVSTQVEDRRVRYFRAPRLTDKTTILAGSISGIRAFGSNTDVQEMSVLVAEKQLNQRENMEETTAWHRTKLAASGKIYDPDGSTVLLDCFSEFGVTQTVLPFAISGELTGVVKDKCRIASRHFDNYFGSSAMTGMVALCSPGFFDVLINKPEVKTAYENYRGNSDFLVGNQRAFEFAGVMWYDLAPNYSNPYVTADEAALMPKVSGLFEYTWAPADYVDTVNTAGQPFYSRMKMNAEDTGQELLAQSRPVNYCTRPGAIIRCKLGAS